MNDTFATLTDADIGRLNSCFISNDFIKRSGIRRVDDVDGAEIVGRRRGASANYAGLVFPYFWPSDSSRTRENRLRRDKPDHEYNDKGELKEKAKYLSPPGRSNMLYFPPGLEADDLKITELPIVITEGEKKTLALKRLSDEGPEDRRFIPIGLSGVWNWRGNVGKVEKPSSEMVQTKGPIPDLDLITWAGRMTYILFDANVLTNDSVRAARANLARELAKRGAEVLFAELPADCGVNGIDDLLGKIEKESGTESAIKTGFEILKAAKAPKKKGPSQAGGLIGIAENADLFYTPDGEKYASIDMNGHLETHRIDSRAFREHLARQFFEEDGRAPSSNAMNDALRVLEAKARFEGVKRPVFLRFAASGGNLYMDLCNSEWEVVEMRKDGYSIMTSENCPVRFRRTKQMGELPRPNGKGSLAALRQFLNIGEENNDAYLLVLGWLVNSMRPDYPFPILALTGEPGTAKTTKTILLRQLVDPTEMSHRTCPRNEHDLMIAANSSWVCAFDNVSSIPDWLSDSFCRLSTGGGIGRRTLYANDEETVLKAKRPIILNGIGAFATRSDLIDRAIVVELKVIPKDRRVSEREFWAKFEQEKATIFTGLVNAVCTALKNLESVNFAELPRMADFAQWGTAAEPALGIETGGFMAAYSRSRASLHSVVLEASAIGELLQDYCRERGTFHENFLLKDFLVLLTKRAGDKANDKTFPKFSLKLRNEIQRINPNLRELGIEIEFLGKSGALARKGASLAVRYVPQESSQSSQPLKNKDDGTDDTCDDRTGTCMSIVTNGRIVTENVTNSKPLNGNSYVTNATNCDEGDVSTHDLSCLVEGSICPECNDGDLRRYASGTLGCEFCGHRVSGELVHTASG